MRLEEELSSDNSLTDQKKLIKPSNLQACLALVFTFAADAVYKGRELVSYQKTVDWTSKFLKNQFSTSATKNFGKTFSRDGKGVGYLEMIAKVLGKPTSKVVMDGVNGEEGTQRVFNMTLIGKQAMRKNNLRLGSAWDDSKKKAPPAYSLYPLCGPSPSCHNPPPEVTPPSSSNVRDMTFFQEISRHHIQLKWLLLVSLKIWLNKQGRGHFGKQI